MRAADGIGPGIAALAAVGLVTGGAFAALLMAAGATGDGGLAVLGDRYIWRVVWFSLWQAAWSTLLSVALAVPVARALARRGSFPGRTLLLRLFALPLALPALVAVLGVLEVWGRQGWINGLLQALGLDPVLSIYGLPGILLAHVFFNLPLAVRLLLARLDAVPAENWRLAAQLGLSAGAVLRHIEWPVLRQALPGVAGLVFMLCLASFTIVLVLGGGPRATTMEVAIYQALRFDFDPVRAVVLALLQLGLTGLLLLAGSRLIVNVAEQPVLLKPRRRFDGRGLWPGVLDAAAIALAAGFVLLPLGAVVIAGLAADLGRLATSPLFWRAAATSLGVAGSAAIIGLSLGWALAGSGYRAGNRPGRRNRAFAVASGAAASLILVMPPVVIGAGWFVALYRVPGGLSLAPLVVIAINGLMAVPFVNRILAPAIRVSAQRHDRLCASLGVAGWNRWRLIDWPALRRPLAMAAAFAMALSLGDLGAIALFGDERFITLPLLLMQSLSSYRTADAAGLALLLGLICLALVAGFERGRPGPSGERP